jgi:hypothetical protein
VIKWLCFAMAFGTSAHRHSNWSLNQLHRLWLDLFCKPMFFNAMTCAICSQRSNAMFLRAVMTQTKPPG